MWRLSVKSERWWERWAGRSYPRLYLSLVSTRLREVLVNNSPRRYLAGFYPTDRDIWTDCGGGGLIYFCIKKRNTSRSLGLWEMTRQWAKKVSTKARYWELWDERERGQRAVEGRVGHLSLFISDLSSSSPPARREERQRGQVRCLHTGRKIVLILPGITDCTAMKCSVSTKQWTFSSGI